MLSQRNTNSPSPIVSRTESVSSMDSKNIGHFGLSRGPSPLTLGIHDAIPLGELHVEQTSLTDFVDYPDRGFLQVTFYLLVDI